jgi:hypothetical protein
MRNEKGKPVKQPPVEPIAEAGMIGRFKVTPSTISEPSPKVPKVRQAGHLVEQKLKYNYPVKDQPSLFDLLDPNTIGEVEKVEVKYEGIRLTPSEDRLLTALYTLLKDKSESKDSDSKKFYAGNYETTEVVPFGGETVKPVHIRLIPAELYKAYLGNEDYSGKEIRDINKTLASLAEKRFLMKYDRVRTVQVGKQTENRTDRIEMFKRLIEIVKYTRDLTDAELAKLDKGDERIRQAKGELIIALNPILTDQIGTKWVEYPQDINRRTIIAAGGDHRNVTEAINTLRDLCLTELSKRRYEFQRNADKLPYILKLDNYVTQGRKTKLKQTIEKAIQTCKNLNLLLEVVVAKGAEGQDKYTFMLNKDFE